METGILGSLRWWYEAILRGLGFHVCDPGKRACLYDKEKGMSSICLACQLFGCTGYGRRFRLVIREDSSSNTGEMLEIKLRDPGSSGHRGWRIPGEIAGPLRVSFLPMCPSGLGEAETTSLYYTLHLIDRFGALGAKTSQGQGVIRVLDWDKELQEPTAFNKWYDVLSKKERLKQELETRASDTEGDTTQKARNLPDIKNMVGATVILEDAKLKPEEVWSKLGLTATINHKRWLPAAAANWLPSAPAVRAYLRSWLRELSNIPGIDEKTLANERHRLMGTTNLPWGDPCLQNNSQDRPKSSDVFVTHLYRDSHNQKWTTRIFGFIPRDGNEVDMALRLFLTDTNRLKTEVQAALGGLNVGIIPYPADMKGLLV